MDRIQDDAGCNTIPAGSSSDRRMQQQQQQHQQNSGSRSDLPAHPPPPPPQQGHKCPRCDSTNTKFCYYNNYSLSQPRYFCKACRRYWTHGGTLRNVPFGGGFRKGPKRTKTSTTATAMSTSSATVSSHSQPPAGTVTPAIVGSNISYYPSGGGGFLSSLEEIQQSLGRPELDLGGSSSSGVNIGLLQGLGILPALSSQAQLFRGLPPPPPSSSNNEWFTQGLSRNHSSNNENPSDHIAASANSTGFWNLNRTSGAVNSATAGDGDIARQGAPLNPNQWLGLPGYGPPQ